MSHRVSEFERSHLRPRRAIRHDDRKPGSERFGDAHAEAFGVRALHERAARGEERAGGLRVNGAQPARCAGNRSEQRFDTRAVAILVRPGDDESRAGPRAVHDGEGGSQQVEPLDRMQPPETQHHLVRGLDLRALPQPLQRLERHRNRRHAVGDRHHGRTGLRDLLLLDERRGVQKRRAAEVRALAGPVRGGFQDTMPPHRRRLQHASRRDDVRPAGAASAGDGRRAGHVPDAVHVNQVGRGQRPIEGGGQSGRAPVPLRPRERKVADADALVLGPLRGRCQRFGPVRRGREHLDLDASVHQRPAESEDAARRPAVAEGRGEVGGDVEDSHSRQSAVSGRQSAVGRRAALSGPPAFQHRQAVDSIDDGKPRIVQDHLACKPHAVRLLAVGHRAAVVQRDDAAGDQMRRPVLPVAFEAGPAVIAVDEQKVDGRRPVARRIVAPLAQQHGLPARVPGQLVLREEPLEAHPEPARRMSIDAGDDTVGRHHAAEQRGRRAVHDADLDQAPATRSVTRQARALGGGRLRVRVDQTQPIPRIQEGRAIPDAHFECG